MSKHSSLIKQSQTSDVNKGYILPTDVAVRELSVYLDSENSVNPFKDMNILTTWFGSDIENNAFLSALMSMKSILQWNSVTCLFLNNESSKKVSVDKNGKKVSKEISWSGAYVNDKVFERELKKSDIVVTCDSFFYYTADLIKQCMQKFKKFIILGSKNIISNKEIYLMFENHELWLGGTLRDDSVKFYVSDEYSKEYGSYMVDDYGRKYVKTGKDRFFTNMDYNYRHRGYTELTHQFNPEEYKMCDNFNVIDVDGCKNIPYDFTYPMAVTNNVVVHMDSDGLIRFCYKKGNMTHIVSYVLEGSNKTAPMNASTFSDGQFDRVIITRVSDEVVRKTKAA